MTRAHLGAVLGPVPLWAGGSVVAGSLAARAVRPAGPGRTLDTLPLAGIVALAAALLGVVVLLLLARSCRDRVVCPPLAGVLALTVVTAAVWSGVVLRADAATHGVLPTLAAEGGVATVSATVVTEPRPIAGGWQVIGRVAGSGRLAAERVAFVLETDPPALGDRLTVVATARPLPDGGYGDWLAQQHVRVVLDVRHIRTTGHGGPAARATEWLRARVRTAATRHLDERYGGLLVGFVTGDTRLLPTGDRAAMQATSLSHLTAVSGTNVAIVIAGVLAVAGVLRLGVGARRLAVATIVPWFAFLTRFEPSVLRAGTMALLLLLAATRGQLRDARHALAVAVLLLVLLDPRLAGSLGLLLSAMATGGVLVLAPALRARLPNRIPRRVATLLSVTLGAQIAVLPALLVAFGELSVASVPANLVAVPAAIVAATLAFVGTVLAVVSTELAAVVFALAGPGAAVVLGVANALAEVGWRIELARPATVVAVAAAVVWTLASRASAVRWVAAAGMAVALVWLAVEPLAGGIRPQGLRITAIDVGQGDAFLIESPGTRVLVDGGEDDRAARWLARHGRRHLDLVVVTHPHRDHVGGVPAVLRTRSVGALWWRPLPTALPEAADALAAAGAQAVAIRVVQRGEHLRVGDLDIEVLHPPPGRPHRWARSELNETSTVLRITHRGARVLLTGDIEAQAQADLLAAVPDQLRAEVLVVPHHGAATSDVDFLAHVAPEVALISAGSRNRHGHPHADTVTALVQLGAEVRRTDLEGTVTIDVDPPPEVTAGGDGAGATATRAAGAPVRVPRTVGMPATTGHPLPAHGHDEEGCEDGRVPAVPPHGHTAADPVAVLAGCGGRRGLRRVLDAERRCPVGSGRAAPRPDRGARLRGAAHRAVPYPLRAAAHGRPARAGTRRPPRRRSGRTRGRLRRPAGPAAGGAADRSTGWSAPPGARHATTARGLHPRRLSGHG